MFPAQMDKHENHQQSLITVLCPFRDQSLLKTVPVCFCSCWLSFGRRLRLLCSCCRFFLRTPCDACRSRLFCARAVVTTLRTPSSMQTAPVLQYLRTVHGPADVQFVSSTEVLCRQPDMTETNLGPFPVPSYLEVSVDGQKFSQSLKEYNIVGPPVAINPCEKTITVEAAGRSTVPDLKVHTLDKWGHQVLDYDLGNHSLTAVIKEAGGSAMLGISGVCLVPWAGACLCVWQPWTAPVVVVVVVVVRKSGCLGAVLLLQVWGVGGGRGAAMVVVVLLLLLVACCCLLLQA